MEFVFETDYDRKAVTAMAETGAYFVFLFGKNHARVYDKASLTGGTAEQFRGFVQEKTGKPVVKI